MNAHPAIRFDIDHGGDIGLPGDPQASQEDSILVGRTGSGKSAVLSHLKANAEHAIEISPEELSLVTSQIPPFCGSMKNCVDLDIFYRLLWQHIFVVEIVRERYGIRDESTKRNFFQNFFDYFKHDEAHTQALKYFESWGSKFWLEMHKRVREVTNALESQLKQSAMAGGEFVEINAESIDKLSIETKRELVANARAVVNKVQIRELHDVVRMLR